MTEPPSLHRSRSIRPVEDGVRVLLLACAVLSVVTTAAIVVVLTTEAASFFQTVSPTEFLFGTRWAPLLEPTSYGVLPLVCGTMLIVAGTAVVALPIGLGSAIYLSEYASARSRSIIKPILEILAGIPTVVYGYFALTFLTPAIRNFVQAEVFNALSASIVVGVMVLPMVASLCDDALRAVPQSLRQGAYALGATRSEVTTRVVVPAALSGILASFILALSRAIGETMAVTLAAGATPNLTVNPLESIQTMTAFIAQVSTGDADEDRIGKTIFAVAALLFTITLTMNLISHRIMKRFREVYE